MNIADYKKYDVLNGIGLRHSIFFSGCNHFCKGCFNGKLSDFNYGEPFTENLQNMIIEDLNNKNVKIEGLSLLGGCPFCNAKELIPFIRRVNNEAPNSNIWAWAGETFEEILEDEEKFELLKLCDVLVDGRFDIEKRNVKLNFRGN